MKEEPIMDIALANDEYYFVGLWNTVLSLLASTPDASRLRINIIDTGISDESWNRLADAIAKHPAPPTLVRIVFPRERLEGLNVPGPRSPLVYARLFLPEILDCERVLYLDSDLLVFKNVLELEDVDLSGHACAAVINEDAGTLDFDLSKKEYTSLQLDPKAKYFNAGLLYMNLTFWRANNYTSKCLSFLQNHQFRLADQSALNAVMSGEILPIAKQWNRLVSHISASELTTPNFVIHYTSHKPWQFLNDAPAMLLWRKFAFDTGLDLSPPHKRQDIYTRYLALNFLRTVGYGLKALWYAFLKKIDLAEGYAYAFSYWAKHFANRRVRAYEFKLATLEIQSTQYGPNWMLDKNPEGVESNGALSVPQVKLAVKGKALTSLLRDRGRTRHFLGSHIQRQRESHLKDVLKDENKLRMSGVCSDVPISITSWPPRAHTLPLVLLSMLEQSICPSGIHVWLSFGDEEMVPDYYRDFFSEHGVVFHATEDIIPHKKWLPMLEMGVDTPFAIIDDDTYYPKDMFEALVTEGAKYPRDIVAHRCHRISVGPKRNPLAYTDWQKDIEFDGSAGHDVFPTGCGGILIHPEAIGEDFRRRDLIGKLCPRADDVWLKAAYLAAGSKCRKSRYHFPCLDFPGTRDSGLAVANVDQGGNDLQFREVLKYFDLKLDS